MSQLWREPNRAKWVGIRPGHDGEQMIASSTVSNSSDTMYTVPTNYVLLLFSWWSWTVATGAGTGSLGIYNDTPALYRRLSYHRMVSAGERDTSHDLFVPIEVPAGYSIVNESSAAVVRIDSVIFGIVIPDT